METITRTECTDEKRIHFLPTHVSQHPAEFLRYEHLTYNFMEKACAQYGGGFWAFYELSNGGFYMAPENEKPFQMKWDDNYFEGEMSADAAGIGVSLMAQNAFACAVSPERFGDKFYALHDYAVQHDEAGLILGFID